MISNSTQNPSFILDHLPTPMLALDDAGCVSKINLSAKNSFRDIAKWENHSIEMPFAKRVHGKRGHLWNLLKNLQEGESLTRTRLLRVGEGYQQVKLSFTRTQGGFFCHPEPLQEETLLCEAMLRYVKTLGIMELVYEGEAIKVASFNASFFNDLFGTTHQPKDGDQLFNALLQEAHQEDKIKIKLLFNRPDTYATFYISYTSATGDKGVVKVYLIKKSRTSHRALVFIQRSEDNFQKAIEERLLAMHTAQSFHDINQPLFQLYLTLDEFKDWVAKRGENPGEQGSDAEKLQLLEKKMLEFAEDVESQYFSAATISKKVTDSFQLSQGGSEIKVSRIHLGKLLDSLEHSFMRQSKNTNVAFTMVRNITCEEELLADDGKIRRMISNLVGNAFKFTANFHNQMGGQVDLTVDAQKHPVNSSKILLRVAVQDNGPGIPENRKKDLFSPGIQLQNTVEGLGLGLSIVKSFVESMEGHIHVENPLQGSGARFVFDVLVGSTAGSPRIEKKKMEIEQKHSGLRVLIADDNALNLRLMEGFLTRMGYDVTKATDGGEAINILENSQQPGQTPFDFAFFDQEMKLKNSAALNGDEAVKIWREKEKQRGMREHLPIFALTGSNTDKADQKLLRAGMDGVLHKVDTKDQKKRIYEIVQEHVINKRK